MVENPVALPLPDVEGLLRRLWVEKRIDVEANRLNGLLVEHALSPFELAYLRGPSSRTTTHPTFIAFPNFAASIAVRITSSDLYPSIPSISGGVFVAMLLV